MQEQRNTPEFISIIWGYHKQLFSLSVVENYHLQALHIAHELGFKLHVVSIAPQVRLQDDPHFPSYCQVEEYRGWLWYLIFLWRHRRAVVYANTFILQSFIVPFICRRAIFMGHDSVKRKTWSKQVIQNFILKRFSKVRVVTQEEKQFLIQQGMAHERIAVVPLAIDVTYFREMVLSPKKGIVVLGNATSDKDVITILKALAEARKIIPELTLDIVGELRDKRVEQLISELGLQPAVSIHGFVVHTDLPVLLSRFLICVNSSVSEGQCLAVYEAALCGTVLCLPNILSFSGVFKNKALFHEVGDYRQLAKNIESYYHSSELIERHKRACREIIMASYRPPAINVKLKDLFASV